MKKQTDPNIKAYLLRSAFYLLLLLALGCFVFIGKAKSAFHLPGTSSGLSRPAVATSMMQLATHTKALTFADRVAYQRAIEEVYWQHRSWPDANGGAKPPLDKVMSQAQIEKKVENYLRDSQALENYWQKPITPDQLQAEMDRMARHTKQPGVLREIFAALGNDPYVIAECLARPALADRLARNLYAHDARFHGELKRRAEADLLSHSSVAEMKQTSGAYSDGYGATQTTTVTLGSGPPAVGGQQRSVRPAGRFPGRAARVCRSFRCSCDIRRMDPTDSFQPRVPGGGFRR